MGRPGSIDSMRDRKLGRASHSTPGPVALGPGISKGASNMDSKSSAAPNRPEEVIRVGEHFYVLAVSSRTDDRTSILKHGDTLAVFDRLGDIFGVGLCDQGVFHAGTRYLSRLELTINDATPLLLGSNLDPDSLFLGVDMTNPDLALDGKIVAPRGTLYLQRFALLWQATLHQHIRVSNVGSNAIQFRLRLRFGADFSDIFEVRGVRRARRGRILDACVADQAALLPYDGLDGVRRTTMVTSEVSGATRRVKPDHIEVEIDLAPGQDHSLEFTFSCTSERIASGVAVGAQRSARLSPARYTLALSEANARIET